MEEKAGQQNRGSSTLRWTAESGAWRFSWKIFQFQSRLPAVQRQETGRLSRVLKIISDRPRPSASGSAPLLPLNADWPKAVNQILNDEGTEAGRGDNGSAKTKSTRIHHRCCYETEGRAVIWNFGWEELGSWWADEMLVFVYSVQHH